MGGGGGYSGFAYFSSFNDFLNMEVYSGFNENLLKQLKTRIRKHKINKLYVHNEHVYKLQFLNSWLFPLTRHLRQEPDVFHKIYGTVKALILWISCKTVFCNIAIQSKAV